MNLQAVTPAPAPARATRAPAAPVTRVVHRDIKPENRGLPLALGDLVPVERLTSLEQRFACVPLSARLSAGTCVERQRLAVSTERGERGGGLGTWRTKPSDAYQICRGCVLGAKVRARLEAAHALGRVAC